MKPLRLALLLPLLAACASDEDGTSTPAPVLSDTDLDTVTDATDGEPGACAIPVDTALLTGRKWRIDLSLSELVSHCEIPPTNPQVCAPAMAMVGDFAESPVSMEFEVLATRGYAMDMRIRLDSGAADPGNSAFLLPPVGFATNPCFEADMFDFDWPMTLEYSYLVMEFHMEAAFAPDLSALHFQRWRLVYDAARMIELVGIDVCALGSCEPDGTILLQLKDLEASLVESPAP